MYKQQAKSSHNALCRWIMHGAESSDSDHWNAPCHLPPRAISPGGWGAGHLVPASPGGWGARHLVPASPGWVGSRAIH